MPELDAVGVVVADMEESLSFYRLLGLSIPDGAGSEGHVEVTLAGGVRVMFDSEEVIRTFRRFSFPEGDRGVALAFRCEDPAEVDATYRLLTEAGHRGEVPPFDAPWGQRYATVLDPDGNPVDLYASSTA